jgi:hypothetical protein
MIEEADEVADASIGPAAFKPTRWPSRGERSSQPTIRQNACALAIENSSDGRLIAEIVDSHAKIGCSNQSLTWSERPVISTACESNLDNDTIVSIDATIGLFKVHLLGPKFELFSQAIGSCGTTTGRV